MREKSGMRYTTENFVMKKKTWQTQTRRIGRKAEKNLRRETHRRVTLLWFVNRRGVGP